MSAKCWVLKVYNSVFLYVLVYICSYYMCMQSHKSKEDCYHYLNLSNPLTVMAMTLPSYYE